MFFCVFNKNNLVNILNNIIWYVKFRFFMFTSIFSIFSVLAINLIKTLNIKFQIVLVLFALISMIIILINLIISTYKEYKEYKEANKHKIEFINRTQNINEHIYSKNNRISVLYSSILFTAIIFLVVIASVISITIPFQIATKSYNKTQQIRGKIISFPNNSSELGVFSNNLLKIQDENIIKSNVDDYNGSNKNGNNNDNNFISKGVLITIKTNLGLITYFSKIKELDYGDTIIADLEINEPSMPRNPGGFDEKSYLESNGIYIKGNLVSSFNEKILEKEKNPIVKCAYETRNKIIRIFNKNITTREAALMAGVLIGDRSKMSKEECEIYKKAGLSHITAVSGSAITFLLIPLNLLLRSIKISKKKKSLITIFILVFFGFITGWSASISRALLMVFIIMISKLLHENMSTIQSLFISITLLIAINPIFALNAGFYLSSLATAGILELTKSMDNILSKTDNKKGFIKSMVSTSITACIAVLPISVLISGEISLSSVISSIVVLPLVEIATILGSILAFAGFLNENFFLTQILGVPLQGVLYSIRSIALLISKIDILHFSIIGMSFFITFSITIFTCFVFFKNKSKKKILLIISLISFVSGISHTYVKKLNKPDFEIVFADVGQGDSTLIMLKSGQSILIDSGNISKGFSNINNMFEYYSISYPSIYIATHAHEDHCGGMTELIKKRGGDTLFVPFNTININESNNGKSSNFDSTSKNSLSYGEVDISNDLLNVSYENGLEVREIGDGDILTINNDLKFYFYNPMYKKIDNNQAFNDTKNISANESSLVIYIKYKEYGFLVMGDATKSVEDRLIKENKNLKSIVYRISHHGSPTSTNRDIIDAVDSKFAIISVGYNLYGHPSPKVIDRLEEFDTRVLRTDESGAIIVSIKKDIFTVNTMIK